MVAGRNFANANSLRSELKRRTRPLHDELDGALGEAPLDQESYALFLAAQYAARAPIERWAAANLDDSLRPPPTASLIAADLAELHAPLPAEADFALPHGADPVGLGWALGGSSMGNRAMLMQRRKAGFATAERFLADPATAAFFRALLPRLSAPVAPDDADAAVLAAQAVFETFLTATRALLQKAAA